MFSVPYRCNVVRCQSLLYFGQNVAISTVKTATVALARSCDALKGSPLVAKLVPVVGIIIFALRGLGPLVRMSRNIFLHKTDSSWRKSTASYVLTSYLQPILLWTGATLICRALDPITMPTTASELVKQRLLTFVKSLSTVLAFAYCLSSVIQQAHKYSMETNDPTNTRNMGFQFAGRAIYTAVWVAAVCLFMELLGFSTQKWLTAGGLGTVLLTLAGREIFTNFLSSVMIHVTRPFVVNEWIQAKIDGSDVSGTVEHVGWWSPTIIRGDDREAVHIPNHKFTVNVVRNLSQKTHWRIKTHLAISHLDVSKINSIVADMRKILAKHPLVEQQKLHRRVFLENINPENQALQIMISCFVKTTHSEEYLRVKEVILLDLLRVVRHHRARLGTPIRTIQKFYDDTELGSRSFSETIFTHGGLASTLPLLLIEPSYKANGENKSNSPAHTMQASGEQDVQRAGQPAEPRVTKIKVRGTSMPELDTEAEDEATLKLAARSNSELAGNALDQTPSDMKASNSTVNRNPEMNGIDGKSKGRTDGLQSKRAGKLPVSEPPLTPTLQENIVLGVALEGSKRTLPIEELDSPPTLEETKELATRRNGDKNSAVRRG
uniref:Mechanosensitive ion channel protein n=1 Tax=Opuntia streptacantha TaxID=393608 RepID=A0A7C9CN81_OPUST